MFCSNCGNRLAEGAKFCSACGNRVQEAGEQEFRFGSEFVFEEPKRETAAKFEREEAPAPRRESVSFDWSAVVDEPHKKEIPDVKSPWGTTGGINEKELYAEMTPSTDRSRTMSFIDVLKAEKEEKEKRAEERAFVYTEVLEVEDDMSSFNDAPTLTYAPLYEDVDAPVKTPFDNIGTKPERRTFDNTKEPSVETSRETIAQFEEYVKSFEAEAGIIHDEPRFEQPAPPRPVSEEPKFELPDFLKRAAAPAKEEPAFEEPVFEQPEEEPEFREPADLYFGKDTVDEPTFEVPKIEETEEEPAFEEPKYEEPAFEEPKYDEEDFDDAFDEYLDIDTGRKEEPVDEEALFAEMEETKPVKTGMTIAAPAEKEAEVEALRKRLMELTGTDIKLDGAEKEPEEEPAEEPAKPEELSFRPETTADVDEVFSGLSAASEKKEEPEKDSGTAYENPEDLYLSEFPEPAAPAEEEPVLLVLDGADEPEPAAPAEEEPVLLVLDDLEPEPAPSEEPAVVVIEEVKAEEPAAVVIEEVKAEEPADVLLEEVKAEEPKADEPEEGKSSDALSLEELEKDLFGETPTAEAEAEETKKIDKFYTLYRKNEEFQRLLDEEYDKLKGEGAADAPKAAGNAEAAAPAEIPAEQSKAYRQVEDETIYKAFEIPPELVKAPPKEAEPAAAKAPVPQGDGGTVYKKDDKKADRKADKAAAKAEKARQKQEKKELKAKAKAEAAATGVEYEEVDTGSGFLTVLAVIIAIILVILLAVILILQVAPDSGIAIAIDSLIENLTGGFGAIDPGNGPFLL